MKRPKRVKCEFCNSRYVSQYDYRTAEENKICMTCSSFKKFVSQLEESLNAMLLNKIPNKKAKIIIE